MVKRNGRDGEVVCLEATEFPAADVREKQEGGGGGISEDLKFVVAYFCTTFFLGYQHTSLT